MSIRVHALWGRSTPFGYLLFGLWAATTAFAITLTIVHVRLIVGALYKAKHAPHARLTCLYDDVYRSCDRRGRPQTVYTHYDPQTVLHRLDPVRE